MKTCLYQAIRLCKSKILIPFQFEAILIQFKRKKIFNQHLPEERSLVDEYLYVN